MHFVLKYADTTPTGSGSAACCTEGSAAWFAAMRFALEPDSSQSRLACIEKLQHNGPITSFQASNRAARSARRAGADERPFVLTNCTMLDVCSGATSHRMTVILRGGKIERICRDKETSSGNIKLAVPDITEGVFVDVGGSIVMPGLCDAHVHCTAVSANLAGLLSLPESLITAKSAHILQGMLERGFTTIRDAGGADFGLAQVFSVSIKRY